MDGYTVDRRQATKWNHFVARGFAIPLTTVAGRHFHLASFLMYQILVMNLDLDAANDTAGLCGRTIALQKTFYDDDS